MAVRFCWRPGLVEFASSWGLTLPFFTSSSTTRSCPPLCAVHMDVVFQIVLQLASITPVSRRSSTTGSRPCSAAWYSGVLLYESVRAGSTFRCASSTLTTAGVHSAPRTRVVASTSTGNNYRQLDSAGAASPPSHYRFLQPKIGLFTSKRPRRLVQRRCFSINPDGNVMSIFGCESQLR
jgi:hypothetical protein